MHRTIALGGDLQRTEVRQVATELAGSERRPLLGCGSVRCREAIVEGSQPKPEEFPFNSLPSCVASFEIDVETFEH